MKIYNRRKTGLNIVSGPVKAIEPAQNGAQKVTIEVEEYDTGSKSTVKSEVTATSNVVSDGLVVGAIATAVGYQWGKGAIMASYISVGPHVESMEDVEIISGLVQKAVYKDELNEDGSPKLKRDNTPRKPHFDISVLIPDEEGHRVSHIVKVYNFSKSEDGKLSNIERMQRRFNGFKDKDSTPIECTIVTAPGTVRSWESEFKGKVYQNYCCDHMGVISLDLNYLYEKESVRPEQTQTLETSTEPVQPAPAPASAPTQAQTPVQEPVQPTQPVYGGPKAPEVEDESFFA